MLYRITYHVKIQDQEYEFFLDLKEDKTLYFIVPDVGGQADMVPKFPKQLEWTEKQLDNMKNIKRVWNTVWELLDEEAIMTIERLFTEKAELVKKERLDY